jgi:molybdate transport system ATP-binding protein
MKATSSSRRPAIFLSLQNATFRLGDRLVFENFTWTFYRHQQWAIIGPNGSGKSILADALRGCLPLVHGELRYHFKSLSDLSPEESIGQVAFEDRKSELHGSVVQSRWASFEEEASSLVADFLSYERVMDVNPFEVTRRHATALPTFQRRMNRAIRLLQIETFLSRRLLSLSNGERQRVQLARALARPLRLLILDEPYVGLDLGMREYFHKVLERLLQTSLRVLVITARVEDLPRHVTHLLRVEDCRFVAAGPRAQILSHRGIEPRVGSSTYPKRRTPANRVSRSAEAGRTLGTSLIELRNVTVRYGAREILRNLSWNVREAESWALLGPNGSGKSTLLSLILGDNPQAYVNEVFVFGHRRGDGESIWHLKRQIGWVSPELQLHFDDSISVRDAVLCGFYDTIGLFQSPTRPQTAAGRNWLRRFGLMELSSLPLCSLSAGLQRMVLLARALVKKPRLLILDEPCQGLDAGHRDVIIHTVDKLIRGRSVTAIFVTHRPEEIPRSVKRVLRLSLDEDAKPKSEVRNQNLKTSLFRCEF